MEQKKYWKGLEELQGSPDYRKTVQDEFREKLPLEESNDLLSAPTPRRDFLKYLGFSVTAATIAASCEIQVHKVIPYIDKPSDITPGVPNYYASTYAVDGDYCAVVVKTRDGRPIKIEGNTSSSVTRGGTSARVQASVLSLYDTARLRYPTAHGLETTWSLLDQQVSAALAGLGAAPVVLLTGSILSPSTQKLMGEFLQKFPGSRQVIYDSISYSGMLMANEACYGKRAIPAYHFEQASVIVSLGADFLGTWLSPVEFANQYGTKRKIQAGKPSMSHHIQFESYMSLTGSNADYRFTHKPSELNTLALTLYNQVAGLLGKPQLAAAPPLQDSALAAGIARAAKALSSHPGASLVVAGSNDPNIQILINGLNELLGSGGKTLDWNSPLNYHQGLDSDMEQLVSDLNDGTIGALLIQGCNPAYDYRDPDRFRSGLSKVPLSLSFNDRRDETSVLCHYIAPEPHYLESWGDAQPRTGYFSFIQPTIAPLFKTRPFQESLMKWTGNPDPDWHGYLMDYWMPQLGGLEAWEQALQDGVKENPALSQGSLPFKGNTSVAAQALISGQPKPGTLELVLYEKVGIGNGRWANNPWLQEMPDPVSKCTWDNYACISPALSEKLGISLNRFNEVHLERPLGRFRINGKELLIPILVLPGMPADVIGVALGYGRAKSVGKAAGDVGVNLYPAVSYNTANQTYDYYSTQVSLTLTGDTYPLAITQMHNSFEGRPIILETTLEAFAANPGEVTADVREEMDRYGKDYRSDATLYPDIHEYPGIKWGMSIDLNSCIGCGACTIACQAENNVSVVGKDQVLMHHEMHWIRIDRYFSGDPGNPQVVFQPMLCQQCDNAPCENVCPVAATNHSSEGLNQMIYNRCVGTRYCMNNCPYKVRRFNWRDWNGSDSFADNLKDTADMNDNLTRMVLNPDVTVRARGVMEKCTFCVQKLQDAKLAAKLAGRPLQDGDAVTACQAACPTEAIVFGNVNDLLSAISQLRASEKERRVYYALNELHTLPSLNYLAKVVNKDTQDFFSEGPQHVL